MNKVVVTGALGFIGFTLSLRLLEKGYEVVGIDGMIDERLKELYDEKLLWIGRNASFTLINKKIQTLDLNEVFKEADTIYHLAAATSRDPNWDLLRTTIEDNVGVTEKILSACNQNTKLIYTSSTQVYGDRSGTITEKTPLNPVTSYSLTKMAAEALIKTKCQEREIPYVIFRLPTIYGPWQRVDMTYSQLIVNEMMNSSKEVDFDRVTEDVLYIDDILDTLIEAGNKKDCKNEIFNLSTGKNNEWNRGMSLLNKQHKTTPQDERLQITISNEKVKEQLGFNVTTDLGAGIKAQKDHIFKYKHVYLK